MQNSFVVRILKSFLIILLSLSTLSSAFTMRVLLTQEPYEQKNSFCCLKTKSGFMVEDVENRTTRGSIDCSTLCFGMKNGFVTANRNRYFLYEENNGTKLKTTSPYIWIRPKKANDLIEWNGHKYPGSILCICEKNTFSIINVLDSEAYVMSVLFYESCINWDLEIQKTFAVMVRTYLVHMVVEARTQAKAGVRKWYDIKSTNAHQTYKGFHAHPTMKQATEETAGLIITYKKKPILAMYDICCGGAIPAFLEGSVDFNKAPYLARVQPCTFCSKSKAYAWETIYPQKLFEERVKAEGKKNKARGSLVSVTVSRTDRAGAVKELTVKWQKDTIKLSGKKVYSLFKKVKSSLYQVFVDKKGVHFVGRGFGHHLGLCQWGAREMIRQGYSYREVLAFYYPQTNLMRLEIVAQAS